MDNDIQIFLRKSNLTFYPSLILFYNYYFEKFISWKRRLTEVEEQVTAYVTMFTLVRTCFIIHVHLGEYFIPAFIYLSGIHNFHLKESCHRNYDYISFSFCPWLRNLKIINIFFRNLVRLEILISLDIRS